MVQSFSVSTDLFKLEDQAKCTVLHPTFVQQFGGECSWIAIFNAGWVFKASSTTEGKYSNPSNCTPGHFLSPARLLVCDFNWKKFISNAVFCCNCAESISVYIPSSHPPTWSIRTCTSVLVLMVHLYQRNEDTCCYWYTPVIILTLSDSKISKEILLICWSF